MPRLLVIAEQYFPLVVPGAFRVDSFLRHLPTHGFSVRLLAPAWREDNAHLAMHGKATRFVAGAAGFDESRVRRYEVENAGVHPIRRFVDDALRLSDPDQRQAVAIIEAGEALYRQEPIDCILASGPPPFVWHAAATLARRLGVSWVADARDIREQVPAFHGTSRAVGLAKRALGIDRLRLRRETALLCSADTVTTVSEALRAILLERGVPNVHVIENGFEAADFAVTAESFDKFTVVFAGNIGVRQTPALFLSALDELLTESPALTTEVQFLFFGDAAQFSRWVKGRACESVVTCRGYVSKATLIPALKGAGLLLHLSVPGSRGIITSKLTEYLGAGAPILSVPGDGDAVDRFLMDTGAGVSCATVAAVKNHLAMLLRRWKDGEAWAPPVSDDIRHAHTREAHAAALAEVLDAICRSAATPTASR